jgi:hypothetical protein
MKSISKLTILCLGLLVLGSPAVHVCRLIIGGKAIDVSPAVSAAEKAPSLTWENLRGLDPQSGKMPADLKKHDGTIVRVPGYIIPLEDSDQAVSEFLLVPYPLACIHVPAPPPIRSSTSKWIRERKLHLISTHPCGRRDGSRFKIRKTCIPTRRFL